MKYIQVPSWKGIWKNPSALLPDDKLIDGNNIICRKGQTYVRPGYAVVGEQLNGKIVGLAVYSKLRTDSKTLLAMTPTDVYYLETTTWKYCTPTHTTGHVTTSTGNVHVTGASTAWSTDWPTSQYQIGFGSMASDEITTWYTVASFDSATTLHLSTPCLVTSTGNHYVIRKCFSGSEAEYFDSTTVIDDATVENILLFTNGIDPIYKYNGTTVSDLTSSGLIGRYLDTYYNHVFVGFPTDGGKQYPESVWVSDIGDPDDFTPGSGSANIYDLLDSEDWITYIEKLKTHVMVYKEYSTTDTISTGDATDPFTFYQNHYRVGTPAGRTVVDIEGQFHVLLGSDYNVYANTGSEMKPVGDEVQKELSTNVNKGRRQHSHGCRWEELELYLLQVPEGSSMNPNKVYVYHYKEGHWTLWTFAHKMTASAIYQYATTGPTRYSDYADGLKWSTLGTQSGSSSIDTEPPALTMGDESGFVYKFSVNTETDNGAAISAYLETKDYGYDGRNSVKALETILTTDINDVGNEVSVSCSTDCGVNFSTPAVVDLGATNNMNQTIIKHIQRGKGMRVKVENVAGSQFKINATTLGFESSGKNISKVQ